jgi:hypothetical protein
MDAKTPKRFHKAVLKMERGLPPNKLVPALREGVDHLRYGWLCHQQA